MCSKNYYCEHLLKNEQIYYVGQIAVTAHIYFDFTGCRKGDKWLRITHLLMLQ